MFACGDVDRDLVAHSELVEAGLHAALLLEQVDAALRSVALLVRARDRPPDACRSRLKEDTLRVVRHEVACGKWAGRLENQPRVGRWRLASTMKGQHQHRSEMDDPFDLSTR